METSNNLLLLSFPTRSGIYINKSLDPRVREDDIMINKVYLALDPGLSKIGVAVSFEGKLAQPLTSFPSHQLLEHIQRLIKEHHPDTIVIGQPDSGPIRDLSVVLHSEIKRIFPGEVILHPEDLTSKEAVKKMVEGGMARKRRQQEEHAAAAALILQDYLDLLVHK